MEDIEIPQKVNFHGHMKNIVEKSKLMQRDMQVIGINRQRPTMGFMMKYIKHGL